MSTGPRGIQGSTGSSNPLASKWILTTASSAVDNNPDSGKVKLYASGGGAVVSFSSTTSGGRDMTAFGAALSALTNNYDTTLTLVAVDEPSTHITIDITSITGPYSSGGTTAFSVQGTTVSSSGTMTQGAQFTITAGNRGAEGVQGYQGSQGYQGHPGPTGVQGHQGIQGYQGVQGPGPFVFDPYTGFYVYVGEVNRGDQGHPANPAPPGTQGFQGPQGSPGGVQGHPGVKGEGGPAGFVGAAPQGVQGAQGAPGSQGPQGMAGDPGSSQGYQGHQGSSPVGYSGNRGPQGDTGPTGYDGHPGVIGTKGNTGHQGQQGPQGSQGSQGTQGHQGEFGFVGDTGPQGYRGNQGASGSGFVISKVYNSEAARIAATGGNLPADGEFGLVAGLLDASFEDYGKLYLYKTATGWAYQADISVRGLTGSQGYQGDRGSQGVQGNTAANVPGVQGNPGYQGDPGSLGTQGYQAGISTPGPQGYQGERGAQGSSSLVGAPAGTGLIYVNSGTLDPTLASLGLGMELSGSSGSRVLVVGPQRPALDSNHIHVYNCSELSGAASLIDSGTGGKNLTITGEGTEYTLGEVRFGSVPWLRGLKNNNTNVDYATNSSLSISCSPITIECVVVWQAFSSGWNSLININNSDFYMMIEAYNGSVYGGVLRGGSNTYTTQNITTKLNVPYHYMVVHDTSQAAPNNLKMYLNGVLTGTSVTGTVTPSANPLTKISVGSVIWNAGGQRGSSQCYIRDVRISNVARAASYAMQSANALTHL